jgi:hypothetical protein
MDPDGRNQRELGADVARIEDMAGMSGRIADQ